MASAYLIPLPKQAMRYLAGFYSAKPDTFFLPRATVESPAQLQRMVFPETEIWKSKFEKGKNSERYH